VIGYIFLRGRLCNIILSKVHDISEDSKESIYEELEHFFKRILMHRMKIILGDCNAKLGRGGVFRLTVGNESLH
jgi:hypothetical protein